MTVLRLNMREKKTTALVLTRGAKTAEVYEWPRLGRYDVIGLNDDKVVMYSSSTTFEHARANAKRFTEGYL